MNLLERRRELLKMRSMGVSLAEAVKDLAERYAVSTRTVYYDWRNRKNWIEVVLGIEDPEAFFLDLVANHGEIYRLASLEYLKGDNSAARIGALRLLRDLNRDMEEMVVTRDVLSRWNVWRKRLYDGAGAESPNLRENVLGGHCVHSDYQGSHRHVSM